MQFILIMGLILLYFFPNWRLLWIWALCVGFFFTAAQLDGFFGGVLAAGRSFSDPEIQSLYYESWFRHVASGLLWFIPSGVAVIVVRRFWRGQHIPLPSATFSTRSQLPRETQTERSNTQSEAPLPKSGSTSNINWKRGLGRLFWFATISWWLAALYLLVLHAPPIPSRSSFIPICAYPAPGQEPIPAVCLSLQESTNQVVYCTAEESAAWREERDRANSEAIRAAAEQQRLCEVERSSPLQQMEIDLAHKEAVMRWRLDLLAAGLVSFTLPFGVALIALLLFRIGLWIRNGFKADA